MRPRLDRTFAAFQRTGDPRALARVFDGTAKDLLRVAVRLTGDPVVAEDMVQETFVAAIEGARQYDASRPLRPWLVGILSNRVRAWRRRAGRRVDPARLPGRSAEEPSSDLAARDLVDAAGEALDRLPDTYRAAVVLHLRHGLPPAAIAESLNLTPTAARTRLHRGLRRLRERLPALAAPGTPWLPAEPRGLEAVRSEVLARVPPPTPAAAAASAGASLLVHPLLALAGLVLVVGVGAAVLLTGPAQPESGADHAPAAGGGDVSGGPTHPRAPRLRGAPPRHAALLPPPAQDPGRPAPHAALRLAVHWEDGRPAEGVHAWLRRGRRTDASHLAPPLCTDAEGFARFAPLAPGPVRLLLDRASPRELTLAPGSARTLEVVVPEGIDVDVEVVDRVGRPVEGAGVWLAVPGGWSAGTVVTVTGPRGRALLRDVADGQLLAVRAPGHAPSPRRFVRGPVGGRVAVRFSLSGPGAALEGRVVTSAREPVSGAAVTVGTEELIGRTLADGAVGVIAPPRVARTDASGRLRLDGLAPGSHPVTAVAAGRGIARREVQLVAGRTVALEIVLEPEAVVAGTVRDASGAPVTGAHVRMEDADRAAPRAAVTGEDGTYRLDGLPAGAVTITATHDAAGRARETLVLRSGTQTRWDVGLTPDGTIEGTVRDATNAPVGGARVQAVRRPRVTGAREARADEAGRFRLVGLPAGVYELRAFAPGASWPLAVHQGVRPDADGISLREDDALRPSVTVEGRIVGPDDGPVATAVVSVHHQELDTTHAAVPDGVTGQFRLGPLPPGTLHLTAHAPDLGRLDLGRHAAIAGTSIDLGELRMETPGTVDVLVTSPSGAPLARGWAVLRGRRVHQTVSIEDGEGTAERVPPGAHVLEVRTHDHAAVVVPCAVASGARETARVRLASGTPHRIRFEPEGPDGAAPRRVFVTIRRHPSGPVVLTWTGAFHPRVAMPLACGLGEGRWLLDASTETGLGGSLLLDVGAPAAGRVERSVVLRPRGDPPPAPSGGKR